MDLKRAAAPEMGGDGPDAKRVASSMALTQSQSQQLVPEEKSEKLQGSMSPSNHVPSYTGNVPYGCTPSLESFLFTQTPAGSELCSWVSDPKSSTTELSERSDSCLSQSSSMAGRSYSKLCRRQNPTLRRQNALRALALEHELTNSKASQNAVLIIHFPDPEITETAVARYSKGIREVLLPSSVAPRQCIAHLKPSANVERTISEINQVAFGNGHLQAVLKPSTDEELAENIDPCSLYVSNIPFNMTTSAIRGHFPNSQRVDIGVIKREKRARYAFVRYGNSELAMEAFRYLVNTPLNNRHLTVRYRRLRKTNKAVSQITISTMTLNSIGTTDDDAAECRVISPPPVQSITVSDSDSHCSGTSSIATVKHKRRDRQNNDSEMSALKKQMAEIRKMLESLQGNNGLPSKDDAVLKKEPQPALTDLQRAPLSPNTLNAAMKLEKDYFDSTTSTSLPAVASAGGGAAASAGIADDNEQTKCIVRRKSKSNAQPNHGALPAPDPHLEQLYAQLESDSDP